MIFFRDGHRSSLREPGGGFSLLPCLLGARAIACGDRRALARPGWGVVTRVRTWRKRPSSPRKSSCTAARADTGIPPPESARNRWFPRESRRRCGARLVGPLRRRVGTTSLTTDWAQRSLFQPLSTNPRYAISRPSTRSDVPYVSLQNIERPELYLNFDEPCSHGFFLISWARARS